MFKINDNRGRVVAYLFVALAVAFGYQNCGSPSVMSNGSGQENEQGGFGNTGSGVICPSGTINCVSGEIPVTLSNEFGCSYSACQSQSTSQVRCQQPAGAFCTTGLVPTAYTDQNNCSIAACVPEAAGGGIGSDGGSNSSCTATDFICVAYNDILGRLPDQPGAQYYMGLINSAANETERMQVRSNIVTSMANSPEARGIQVFDPNAQPMCTGSVNCQ